MKMTNVSTGFEFFLAITRELRIKSERKRCLSGEPHHKAPLKVAKSQYYVRCEKDEAHSKRPLKLIPKG